MSDEKLISPDEAFQWARQMLSDDRQATSQSNVAMTQSTPLQRIPSEQVLESILVVERESLLKGHETQTLVFSNDSVSKTSQDQDD